MSTAQRLPVSPSYRLLFLALFLWAIQAGLLIIPHSPFMIFISKIMLLAVDVAVITATLSAFRRSADFGRMFWGLFGLGFSLTALGVLLIIYNCFPANPRMVPWSLVLGLTGSTNAFLLMCLLLHPNEIRGGRDWLRVFDFAQVAIVYVLLQLYLSNLRDNNLKLAALAVVVEALLTLGFLARAISAQSLPIRRLFYWFAGFRAANLATSVLVVMIFSENMNSGWVDLCWSGMMIFPIAAAITWDDATPTISALTATRRFELVAITQIFPLAIPALLLVIAAKIARTQLQLAAGAIFISFAIYYARLLLTYARQRRSEQALQENNAVFREVLEGCNEAIYLKNLDGQYVMCNSASAEWLGYTVQQLIGKRDADLFLPETAEIVVEHDRNVIQTGAPVIYEQELKRSGGSRTYVIHKSPRRDHQGNIIGVIGVAFDNTERRKYEERLSRQSRLEAIGTLSGGVAHDFNNLLTVILGYNSMILDGKDDPHRCAEQIHVAATQAASLTRQLLAFSRRQILQPQVLNLRAVLMNLNNLLQRLIGEDIELVMIFEHDLGQVKADPGQIEQVIMNLAANARDAMPHGGKLTLELTNVVLDEAYARGHPEVVPGNYVMLGVSDSGEGMSAPTLNHIFEPFFTTKTIERGTGLGLATVYGIVKQSGGAISVYSEPGKGTSFKIYLPQVAETQQTSEAPPHAFSVRGGKETILIVEDDRRIRELAASILSDLGYSVLQANGPAEGLLISTKHRGQVDLLITDVVMPGMGGRELSARVTEQRPKIKVLYMSGYTTNAIVHHGVLDPSIFFLPKPFTPSSLAAKVREVLESKGQSSGATA